MAKSLMICSNANNALKLNESENLPSKYILEGVFAELDKLNRNQRIYQKEEYLKHLQYLRNDIKKGEPLLGELDHPDDRFEVKLKEASHRVIDLWYDANKNVVMGKIELLNTPNGKLAQSIVDQGIPLHISSRAAGTVNSDNTVSIQQIYTYDLVCKPGFAGAVLYRVDESVDEKNYSADVKSFLSNALKMESLNSAPQYGFLNEDVSVSEIKASAVLRKEAKEIQINKQIEITEDMTKPILENENPDSTVGKPLNIGSGGGAAALGIPTANMGGTTEAADSSTASDKEEDKDKKDDKPATDVSDNSSDNTDSDKKEENNEDKEEACPKCGNKPCTCEDKDEDKDKDNDKEDKKTNEGEDEDSDDKDKDDDKDSDKDDSDDNDKDSDDGDKDSDDSDKEDKGVEIIDVEAEFEGDDKKDDDMIKDVEAEYDDKDKDSDDKDSDEDKDKDDDSDDNDDDTSEAKDEDKPDPEEEKKIKEAEKLNDDACKDIEKHKDDIFKKLDDLKATIEKKSSEKKEAKNESIIMAKYPVSMMMTESNFVEFVSLDESQKTKVVNYLQDNNFTTANAINENWKNGVNYVAEIPVWLKHAPENYKELYEAASEQVKQSIATTAKYVLFENQYDVNRFWDNSGLAEANERKLLNESFINNMPKVATPVEETSLPYGKEFIQQIADMASEYNNRRY